MKPIRKNLLIAVLAAVAVDAVPGLAAAACDPNAPPVWDSSDYIPRTASIGDGTVIAALVSIGGHDVIGTCDAIGDGLNATKIGSGAHVANNVTITGVSRVGGKSRIGDNVTIGGATISKVAVIGQGSTLTGGSFVGGGSHVGSNDVLVGANVASSVRLGDDVSLGESVGNGSGGVYIGGRSTIGVDVLPASYAGSADTTIQPGVYIGGSVDIGVGVTVEAGATVRSHAVVYSGVDIGPGAVIGGYDVICASVPGGMTFPSHYHYGCN